MESSYINIAPSKICCLNFCEFGQTFLFLSAYTHVIVINNICLVPPKVIRNDEWTWELIHHYLYRERAFDNIVISPGPGSPDCPEDMGRRRWSWLRVLIAFFLEKLNYCAVDFFFFLSTYMYLIYADILLALQAYVYKYCLNVKISQFWVFVLVTRFASAFNA